MSHICNTRYDVRTYVTLNVELSPTVNQYNREAGHIITVGIQSC